MEKQEKFDILLLELPIQFFSPTKKRLFGENVNQDDIARIEYVKKTWYNSERSQCYKSERPISKILLNEKKDL